MRTAYDGLLGEICGDLGFCGSIVYGEPLHIDRFISMSGLVTADQFVAWVLEAEGMDSSEDARKHSARLRDAFVRHMGTEVVNAAELK